MFEIGLAVEVFGLCETRQVLICALQEDDVSWELLSLFDTHHIAYP